jgi:hypothetical protein
LNAELVKGKIVLCEGLTGSAEALRVGAVGILQRYDYSDTDGADSYPLPSCSLKLNDGDNIHKYIRSTRYQGHVP